MTKYTVASRRGVGKPEDKQVHPIWRGIGCLLILFVPLLSYFLATIVMQSAVTQNWPLPYQLVGYPVLPPDLLKVTALSPLWGFIQAQPNLYAILLFTVGFIVVIGAVISVVYAFAYKFTGPPALGPYDVPPVKVTTKKYKR